jgi:SAM-dependent methyltransferase
MIDRKGVLDRLREPDARIALELGCGDRKRHAEAIGVDLLDLPSVDIVGDVAQVLASLPDGCVDKVWSYHFLEHIEDVGAIVQELGRVCVPGAIVDLTVPHFSNPYYFSDPTHRRPFGLYSMCYFCSDRLFSRRVPRYGITPLFELHSVSLVFKSPPPRYMRYGFKKLVQAIVNSSRWMQEFYEEMLCFMVPCYEVRYVLMRYTEDSRVGK